MFSLWSIICTLYKGISQLCAPRCCLLCGKELVNGEKQLCRPCITTLPRTHFENKHDNFCEQRLWGKVDVYRAFSTYYYRKDESLRELIHHFKYRGNKELAIVLGEEMGRSILSADINKEFDILVPIPIHPKKEKSRGYNQTYYIAQGISNITGMQIRTDILSKITNTDSQTTKSKYERYESIKQAYALTASKESVKGLRMLIIDDVLTTGSTVEVCSQLLLSIPGTRVGIATLACAHD